MRFVAVVLVSAAGVVGCGTIIGATDDRALSDDASTGTGVVPTTDQADGGEPDACAAGQKKCNGACVASSSPEYGCNSADCTPCSLPNTAVLTCTADGLCAAGKCNAGFGACGPATAGCTDDLTTPATCLGCLTACGAGTPFCSPTGCAVGCGALQNCANSCADLKNAPTNCGACGNKCTAGANADPNCVDGGCTTICRLGYAHCDGNPNGPCVALSVFYKDNDGDGYGDTSQSAQACSAAAAGPGYVAQGGDCADNNANVHPGQTNYFTTGYTTASGAISFDYNCDGAESEQAGVGHFNQCSQNCSTGGQNLYQKASSRAGALNQYCGSTRYASCSGFDTPCNVNSNSAPANPCR